MFTRIVWLVLRKDFMVEVRSLEIAYTTLFFAISCVLVFAFALVQEGRAPEGGAAGILWIAIAFAGTLALGRTFERERQSETLRALLLAPAARPAVYLGKLLGIVVLLLAAEVLLVPLVTLLFQAPLLAHPACEVGTCSCPCCCIRSLFRSSLPVFARRRRFSSHSPTQVSSASGWCCSHASTWSSSRLRSGRSNRS
jgi:CcmB protein